MHTLFLGTFGPLVSVVGFQSQQNHKFYRGPSNEHFLPRLVLIGHVVSEKIEMLKFIDNNNDDKER
jgi:hypothetical protein